MFDPQRFDAYLDRAYNSKDPAQMARIHTASVAASLATHFGELPEFRRSPLWRLHFLARIPVRSENGTEPLMDRALRNRLDLTWNDHGVGKYWQLELALQDSGGATEGLAVAVEVLEEDVMFDILTNVLRCTRQNPPQVQAWLHASRSSEDVDLRDFDFIQCEWPNKRGHS